MEYFAVPLILVILIIFLLSCLKIVPQSNQYITEFLGKYKSTWDAGIHFKIPFFERVANKVTLKEIILDSPPQPVITKDNVTMQIDTVVYYNIFDAKSYTYGVVNPLSALSNLTATTLRNIVGDMELDETLSSRDKINDEMTCLLDVATDRWGIKVNRVELKNIIPPKDIQDSMEKQMKAERERRETLLQAEGHKQAVITRAEGDKQAAILQAEGERDARIARAEGEARAVRLAKEAEAAGIRAIREAAPDFSVLELRKYDALIQMSNGRAAKLIVPTDAVQAVTKNVMFSETTGLGDATAPEAELADPHPEDVCCSDSENVVTREFLK
ncbi:MAG: SPFH/Band 7/PHB domain protein [Lachnospiraceae bacterium]|nr:SPFH/Band 7/PHB domain protein [Lachnospiraceae bacterium]